MIESRDLVRKDELAKSAQMKAVKKLLRDNRATSSGLYILNYCAPSPRRIFDSPPLTLVFMWNGHVAAAFADTPTSTPGAPFIYARMFPAKRL
ncbi:hypothetical protein [Burkholderia contaminans]|uniref:hypothetical protein n=1 Tax=Burkholderia contaminans TaxID=488447 RepID=UPI0015813C70|nr:hypothetical protein [Burkholderia contaminans]